MCRQRAGCNAGTLTARQLGGSWKPRGMCRQRAGCNPGAAKADGHACWKLPRRNWRVLGVVGVWSLANGKLECPNKRGLCRQRRVLGILGVWSLANGRLECPNKRGLCAGKRQAAMLKRWRPRAWWKLPRGIAGKGQAATLEQQRLTARLGGSCRKELEGFRGLKPGKRQARMP